MNDDHIITPALLSVHHSTVALPFTNIADVHHSIA